MKKFQLLSLLLIVLLSACNNDDGGTIIPVDDDPDPVNNVLTGEITSDFTLTSDIIWELSGRVTVTSGATLTIEPGTIIKALPGTGANASTLIIARGAKINAVGTAAEPIIFTSIADNIGVGQTAGSNLTENDRGLWGGLLVLGKARASLSGDAVENQIEGIPASDSNGLYGGTNDADNSGMLSFISIRHGGALIGEGNEINGLTLGAVGSGTMISNIEVVANVDDGIEWFGGAVNCSNLLVWAQGDDGLDIDEAYSGTINNAAVVLGDISDHGLEIDGPAGSLEGQFTINNLTMFGNMNTEGGEYADYRDNAMGNTQNVYATGFKASSDVELDNNGVAQQFLDGKLTFSNWVINLPDGVGAANEIFVEKVACIANCDDGDPNNDVFEDKIIVNPSFTERAANWASAGTSGGADLSAFSWTYASSKGAL